LNETSGKSFLETRDEWKFTRYTASHRFPKIKINGGYHCIYCGKAVPKRTKLKWYCNKVCLDDFNVVTGHFKFKVKKRDKNKCAICREYGDEIDHIIPVCEGGGCCGLDNLRTLCNSCHRKETNKLMARRRSKPKLIVTEALEFF